MRGLRRGWPWGRKNIIGGWVVDVKKGRTHEEYILVLGGTGGYDAAVCQYDLCLDDSIEC